MKYLPLIVFLLSICAFSSKMGESKLFSDSEPIVIFASILQDQGGQWRVTDDVFDPKTFIASAKYTVGLESIGWDLLAISTNKNFEDVIQAEAAGRLEGYLTKTRIWNHWRNLNTKANWKNSTYMPDNIKGFFKAQEAYIDELYTNNKTDTIAANAYYLLAQLRGLINSYNSHVVPEQNIDPVEFHTMASFGDLLDVVYYKNTVDLPRFNEWTLEKLQTYILTSNHCSALFKVKEDFSDVYFGHNSWFYYSAMNRIFKEYNFNFNHASIKSRNILFSSYPATLASMDDFYVTSQDLVIIETTNSQFNTDLYAKITPRSLLCWQRAMIANRISTTSREWAENFSKENSGTYNNQFMALDMKKIDTDNKTIADEAMHIVEQLPGVTDINDVTKFLKYGYWPSYNTPFSQKIKDLSKIDEIIKERPESAHNLDYNTCARANIFRRDQGKAVSMKDFMKVIRYNDYLNDPLSMNNPSYAIACRADLKSNCMGAYDAKVSSVTMAKGRNKLINIIQGPSNDELPAFNWKKSDACKLDPHFGLPDEYKYEWYQYKSEFVDELAYEDSSLRFIQ